MSEIEQLCKSSKAGDVETVQRLLSHGVDVNKKSWTPLFAAAGFGRIAVVEILLKAGADVNKDTPLHIAARDGHIAVVEALLMAGADINKVHWRWNWGTPLRAAAENGHIAVVEALLMAGADVNEGFNVPLHAAAENGHLAVVEALLKAGADVNKGTPLCVAAENGHIAIVEALLKAEADVNKEWNGSTPLHYAVTAERFECVKKLLSSPGIDVNIKDNKGKTPLMLASGKYEILKLLRPICQFPVHTFGKVVLCGNSGAGKSTLAQAIMSILYCNEEVGSFFHRIKNVYKAVGQPKPLTAGVIPYNIQSPLANMVLYDLAGHPGYYTSHCACLEAVSLSSPVSFLLLVDLSQDLKDIIHQLHYWSTMISSVCAECPHPSEVIVIGTHADRAKREVLNKSHVIEDQAKTVLKKQHFAGFIALDATNHFSQDMKQFIDQLRKSNDAMVQQSPVISTDCHILYAFLQERVPSEQVITISHLLSLLRADPTKILPTKTPDMIHLLTTLSSKGLILFIYNKYNIDQSWIVLQKNILLQRVAGVLFAPNTFQEYRDLASNTGLVPISRIAASFSDLNAHMLVEFLSELKLCHIVDSTLKIISPSEMAYDWTNDSGGYSLFFPSLVRVSKPDSIKINAKGSFGWLMRTKEEHHFFHNHLIHVLMLNLMNSFSGAEILCNPALESLNRQCTVWSTGICWNSESGVTTLVEVVEQFRFLCVAVSFPGQQYQEVTVLETIRETVKKYCSSIEVEEFIIDPRQATALFDKHIAPVSFSHVQLSKLMTAIMNKQDALVDTKGNGVIIADWVNAEPRLPKLIGIELNSCESILGTQTTMSALSTKFNKDVILQIALLSFDWRSVGQHLIGDSKVKDIEHEEHDEKNRREKMLLTWLQLEGSKATYRRLVEVLETTENNATAEEVTTMVTRGKGVPNQQSPPPHNQENDSSECTPPETGVQLLAFDEEPQIKDASRNCRHP